MKLISVLFCLLFFMGGIANGDQADPRGAQGSQIKKGCGGGSATPGGPHFGPPPEAFRACEGKTVGSKAQFTGPDGETVSGSCKVADGRLVLRPDHPRANSRDERRGPPPEAYKACEGKNAGSMAQFINPRGETVKGRCGEEDGTLVLRPDISRAGDRDQPMKNPSTEGRTEK
jgi:hypothetical protein